MIGFDHCFHDASRAEISGPLNHRRASRNHQAVTKSIHPPETGPAQFISSILMFSLISGDWILNQLNCLSPTQVGMRMSFFLSRGADHLL